MTTMERKYVVSNMNTMRDPTSENQHVQVDQLSCSFLQMMNANDGSEPGKFHKTLHSATLGRSGDEASDLLLHSLK